MTEEMDALNQQLLGDAGFIRWFEETYSAKSQENYFRSLRRLSRQGVNLTSRDSFREWVHTQRKQGLLDRTLNVYIKAFNAVLRYRHEERILFFHTSRPFKRNRATIEDYRAMVSACTGWMGKRDRFVVELLFKTGVRYAELAALAVDDFKDDVLLTRAGKGQKTREIFLLPTVKEAFRQYMAVRPVTSDTGLLLSRYGRRITPSGGRNMVYRIARKAGVKFSPHMARRFYARYLWTSGVMPDVVRLQMGHESYDTTLEYIEPDQSDAMRLMKKEAKRLDFDEKTRIQIPEGFGLSAPAGCYAHVTASLCDLNPVMLEACYEF